MALELPTPIARYFDADRGQNADSVAACFAVDAVVTDEGNRHVGRDAIRQWKIEASARFTYTVEPLSLALDGERTVVTSRLTGSFPGGTAVLRYFFTLTGDAISALEIVP